VSHNLLPSPLGWDHDATTGLWKSVTDVTMSWAVGLRIILAAVKTWRTIIPKIQQKGFFKNSSSAFVLGRPSALFLSGKRPNRTI
jgi:hypothetical protein